MQIITDIFPQGQNTTRRTSADRMSWRPGATTVQQNMNSSGVGSGATTSTGGGGGRGGGATGI